MSVEHIELLVEEPSASPVLGVILPAVLGREISFSIHEFQGKRDLLAKLPARLNGYSRWLPPTHRILVLVDCDGEDCRGLKARLENAARGAGFATKTVPQAGLWQVVTRIAIEELEAWFFGDVDALCAAYPGVAPTVERQRRYRNPDAILGGTSEALERVLQAAGYFRGGLRKKECARAIAPHLNVWRNQSRSFQVLRDALALMRG